MRIEEVGGHLVCREGFRNLKTSLEEAGFDVDGLKVRWDHVQRFDRYDVTTERETDPLSLQTACSDSAWCYLPGGIMSALPQLKSILHILVWLTGQSRGIAV